MRKLLALEGAVLYGSVSFWVLSVARFPRRRLHHPTGDSSAAQGAAPSPTPTLAKSNALLPRWIFDRVTSKPGS